MVGIYLNKNLTSKFECFKSHIIKNQKNGGGVVQSVEAPNSNYKVTSSMPTLGIIRCFVLRKNTLHHNQRRCSSVDRAKVLDSQFCF